MTSSMVSGGTGGSGGGGGVEGSSPMPKVHVACGGCGVGNLGASKKCKGCFCDLTQEKWERKQKKERDKQRDDNKEGSKGHNHLLAQVRSTMRDCDKGDVFIYSAIFSRNDQRNHVYFETKSKLLKTIKRRNLFLLKFSRFLLLLFY